MVKTATFRVGEKGPQMDKKGLQMDKKKAKNGQTVDSGLSEVLLGVVPVNFFKEAKKTR